MARYDVNVLNEHLHKFFKMRLSLWDLSNPSLIKDIEHVLYDRAVFFADVRRGKIRGFQVLRYDPESKRFATLKGKASTLGQFDKSKATFVGNLYFRNEKIRKECDRLGFAPLKELKRIGPENEMCWFKYFDRENGVQGYLSAMLPDAYDWGWVEKGQIKIDNIMRKRYISYFREKLKEEED